MTNIISVSNLTKSYGQVKAVQGISFEVERGTIYGLLGHNGAGKSTTIDCLLGTKKADIGKISILSQDPSQNRKQLFEKVGVQFQNPAYQYRIKVREICEIKHSLYKHANDWRVMLKEFGLSEKENAYVSDLSGGQQQKLFILLAVMQNPELVFLDELTTGLDPKARREVWKYIHGLKQKGTTIFLTSHYMDEVENLCDIVTILKEGKILVTGTVAEVITKSGKSNMDEAFLHFTGDEAA